MTLNKPTLIHSVAPAANHHEDRDEQYSLTKILGLWAVVSVPMAFLAFIVGPVLIPRTTLPPGIVHWLLMVIGMMWQCVVSLLILRRELGHLRWQAVRKRTWSNLPRDPETGRTNAKLFWWLLPCLVFSALTGQVLAPLLDGPYNVLFPFFTMPARMDIGQLADPMFLGQWWLLGLALVSNLFNYFLGEELFFRGVLLPKMKGVFGRWDWLANAVLFGFYHLHKPWALPSIMVSNLAISWPAARFKSSWMAVIVHGAEGVFVVVMVFGVILGLVR